MQWSAEKLPEGLELDSKTGIISGVVTSKGDYTVTLKAENALGVSVKQLVISMGLNWEFIRMPPKKLVAAFAVATDMKKQMQKILPLGELTC